MSDDDQGLTFSERIDAPAAVVYYAFTNAAALREWLCNDAQLDARAGGRIYLWWRRRHRLRFAAGGRGAVPGWRIYQNALLSSR